MSLTFIFLLVLLVTFAVVLIVIRSSETERVVQRRLATLTDEGREKFAETSILKQERLSPVPWLDELLSGLPGVYALLNLVKQSGTGWWVSSVLFGSLACAVVGAAVASLRFEVLGMILLVALAAGAGPCAYLLILRQRRLQACDTQLPQAIELMARALRAGHALNSSIEMVSHDIPEPLASEFRMIFEEQSLGLPLRDALMNLLQRIPRDEMRFLVTALLLQKETGGNLVQILETTAKVMKERVRLRGQIRIYTAQARVTAWVVGALPFIMFLLLNLINPGYETIMLEDPTGIKIVYVGLVMWTAGIFAIRRLIDIRA
jgi:tight adherence protein B